MASSLPIELVKEVFEYLPVPTNELFGEGDGGAGSWRNLKQMTFSITLLRDNGDIYDQIESKEYHKTIQTVHSSPESLIDCYHRPPFFPDGCELVTHPHELKMLADLDKTVVNNFRTRLDQDILHGLSSYQELSQDVTFSEVQVNDLNELEYLDIDYESLVVQGPCDSRFYDLPLKKLKLDSTEWRGPLVGSLANTLEHLIIRVDGNDQYLDLSLPKVKMLEVVTHSGNPSLELILPSNLESLVIDGNAQTVKAELPQSLKTLSAERVENFESSWMTPSLQSLSFIPKTNHIDQSQLKHLTIKNIDPERSCVLSKLPPSLESLEVIHQVDLAVDFTKYPNLKNFSVLGPDPLKMFKNYQGHGINTFSFQYAQNHYSVPFGDNLSDFSLSECYHEVSNVSYPKSLKYLKVSRCVSEFVNGLPELRSLSLKDISPTSIVTLPNLQMLQIVNCNLDMFIYHQIKHFFVTNVEINQFKVPEDVLTLEIMQTSLPPVLDFTNTKLSKVSLGAKFPEFSEDDEFFDDLKSFPYEPKILLPSTIRVFEIDAAHGIEPRVGYDNVNKSILRSI
ncbi:hypothetical protein CLIB1444_04S05600 [[Candida] jaroonii]|uniref:Uncharacterized protein n=1 Tax=[Candida] jaroonii TaxID=467808 RepID=A0ACA9Y8B3_9ASCO|nr:hypothetical protein CLIB1444_04S05600 [[Candida] jaroonii]